MTYETKKNVPFFKKNGKERKDRNVLLIRTDAQPCISATLLNQTVHEHPEPGFWVEQQPFFCPAPAPTPTLLLKYVIFYVSKICFVFSIIKYSIK